MRSGGSRRSRKYLHAVLAAAALAGLSRQRSGRRFDGSRIGRGAGVGRLLGSRDRLAAFRARRAIVKTRLIRLGKDGFGAARAHLRYIQRDGVQRGGSPGVLYSSEEDRADGKAFLERCDGDRHQFRLIVSAEDGDAYDDLKPLIRRFMTQMEQDLGTKLDWVAVDHVDTAQPHSHIMLRGRDELGQNLVIAREYISRGMRERVVELVTLDLGPRQDFEIQQRLRRDIDAERLTSTDRSFLREAGPDRTLAAGHRDPFWHALRAGRLKKLEVMGLAEHLGSGRWRLAPDLEDRLRRMGERGDIIRTMQRELTAAGIARAPAERLIHEEAVPEGGVVGRVVARGLSDELSGRQFLIIDGTDGRAHHIDIGSGDAVEPLPQAAIVRAASVASGPRQSDHVIAEIAARNAGRYSAELHRTHDPGAREEYIQAHVRRLEALRRGGAGIERSEDGTWTVGDGLLDRVATYERRRARASPVRVEMLSLVPLERLAEHEGATWLDRQLDGESEPLRDSGFGREVLSALALRRQWLLSQGLADEKDGEFALRPAAIAGLRRRELTTAAAQLSSELAIPFAPAEEGEQVSGVLKRRIDLASGRFALIEKAHEFTLVPWRPVLERHIGKEVSGVIRDDNVSWTIHRTRGIEI